MRNFALSLPVGGTRIRWGLSWLLVAPVALWLIATIYVPIAAGILRPWETWLLTILIGLLSAACLLLHALAHIVVARAYGGELPAQIPIYPLGDAAQVWPAGETPGRELQISLSAPLFHIVLAAVAYILWNVQLTPYLSHSMLFLVFLNVALVMVNLIPFFPSDGGRLLRVICWRLLQRPDLSARLETRLGKAFSVFLIGWAIFLLAQRTRSSLWTAAITLAFAALILLALWMYPAWRWQRPPLVNVSQGVGRGLRIGATALLILIQIGLAFALVPMNDGLELPGIAPSVAPMIEMPDEYRHPFEGNFILTTVVLQTPILAGQWVVGQVSPYARIVPPERVVPPDQTIQEIAQRNYQMLEVSEMTAAAMGVRLAGYDVGLTGRGVRILSILPESPASAVLQAGDVIVAINGEPVRIPTELTSRLRVVDPFAPITVEIERAGNRESLSVPLMPPLIEDDPPRIGVTIEPAGFDIDLPFPVRIVPQKITGGPSAGLIFTLAVYNLLTPEDLTGGRTIAGTGTIELDGAVGPIGGVQWKVIGAEAVGAEYFLSPPENYEDALAAARRIQVVEVATAEEAIEFLQSLPPRTGR
ncbi:MAG: PDZ domain-containing protein [Caldilineaceae bacterium]|nr:PDZ domain-containing protein [Caldilineaceae bacterium]